ncbi:hypothetical protein [Mycobacterium sherrisii]|uniref:Transmembrane protein n=1 Tax=Mycobacterium sherrisii TaxID=243061 RepID=A0A1E3SUT5_9MYCO|nr:hypothetical protein [Mycobacterium sherrisii]MCV7031333.1 hypothetical protein [Mycobacterium sherrisii]MEC4764467.1 hypothetical protein [Mycobacterium sherrisii]ODR05901.1 hypothetical protein BHQ21_13140 [Mycobacterium sherrisii]ORW78201.1 hypothetical protein AWC25_06335 [Mycobacterium sherrisii]
MTGPHSETESPGTRPISVAELLARNGTIGAPAVTRRRRRRRGDSDAVTVAELTGEIPVIRDDEERADTKPAEIAHTEAPAAEPGSDERPKAASRPETEPRWPKSPPRSPHLGPERSAYPRPTRRDAEAPAERARPAASASGAEDMSPDPLQQYADMPVDVMDSDVREAEPATEDSAYVRSYLQGADSTLFGGQTLADEVARRRSDEREGADAAALAADKAAIKGAKKAESANEDAEIPTLSTETPGRLDALWRGSLIVFQSMVAVAFGAGLFIAFDQLWRWNSLVALVLSVLVILGLVAGVRVVRKTEDIASTLIAVAVGALITLGPLALSMQTG